MNRKTTANSLCALLALAIVVTLCTALPANATGKPEPTPTPSASAGATAGAQAGATAGSSSAIDLSLMNAPAGASIRQGDSWALAAPASAAPLPPGLCPKGDSEAFSIVWGLVSWSRSSTRSEVECLDKVLAMLRDTAPKPVVVNYVAAPVENKPLGNTSEVPRVVLDPPAALECPKKPSLAAPKKHVKAPKCEPAKK